MRFGWVKISVYDKFGRGMRTNEMSSAKFRVLTSTNLPVFITGTADLMACVVSVNRYPFRAGFQRRPSCTEGASVADQGGHQGAAGRDIAGASGPRTCNGAGVATLCGLCYEGRRCEHLSGELNTMRCLGLLSHAFACMSVSSHSYLFLQGRAKKESGPQYGNPIYLVLF